METQSTFTRIFQAVRKTVGTQTWKMILASFPENGSAKDFPSFLKAKKETFRLPPFLAELAEVELELDTIRTQDARVPDQVESTVLNPTLRILEAEWQHLADLLAPQAGKEASQPVPGEELLFVWKTPESREWNVAAAQSDDLAAIKIVAENLDHHRAAEQAGVCVGDIDRAIAGAVRRGFVLAPSSSLKRKGPMFTNPEAGSDRFLVAPSFTLQWHITQRCDLHCKHCYDRSERSPLTVAQGLRILDQVREFALQHHVRGQITFTGGNPFLYPSFAELYQGAVDRGLQIAILGNPVAKRPLERILAIHRPIFYQVSLEGLQEHNDTIRGQGHYQRVMEFLELLRELGVESLVMLTLTSENIDQIIPLAQELRGKTNGFFFNRLSLVGEGANLRLPSPEKFRKFLGEYLAAARENPIMGLKDNLLNLELFRNKEPLFGGCCGFGCGAAFNFLCVLPDGEVHACRKFPSPIGNIHEQSLAELYDSPLATKYRNGSERCARCSIRSVCGGCLAVTQSSGLDISVDRDPFCFCENSC